MRAEVGDEVGDEVRDDRDEVRGPESGLGLRFGPEQGLGVG